MPQTLQAKQRSASERTQAYELMSLEEKLYKCVLVNELMSLQGKCFSRGGNKVLAKLINKMLGEGFTIEDTSEIMSLAILQAVTMNRQPITA